MDGGLLDILGSDAQAWRSRMVRRRYGRDTVIMHEGELGDTLHVIERGRVLVEATTARGDIAALSVRGPGEVIGEMAVVGNGRRSARVTTLEATETLTLSRDTVEDLRRTEPQVDRFLVELLAMKLTEATSLLVEVLFVPVEKRVLRVVSRLADAFDDGDDVVVIRARQEDVAAMAGTRRQTANRPLRMAEEAGAIVIRRGRLEVVDRDLLDRLGR